jgi:hypothetical protein
MKRPTSVADQRSAASVLYCVEVLPGDIRRGGDGDQGNPVARAVRRRLGCAVEVRREHLELDGIAVRLAADVLAWLQDWRAGLLVQPLTFFLLVAAKTLARIDASGEHLGYLVALSSSASVFLRPNNLQSNWEACVHAAN